jgi:hypothetical protein
VERKTFFYSTEEEKMFSSLIVNRKRHLNEKRDEKCQRADNIIHLPTTVAYNVYKASSFRYFFWRNMRKVFHIEISIHFIGLLLSRHEKLAVSFFGKEIGYFEERVEGGENFACVRVSC